MDGAPVPRTGAFCMYNRKGGSREILSIKETMKKWLSFLLAMLMLLGLGSVAMAAEENAVGVIAGNTYYNEALGVCMTLLIGQKKAIGYCGRNVTVDKRNTLLAKRL